MFSRGMRCVGSGRFCGSISIRSRVGTFPATAFGTALRAPEVHWRKRFNRRG